MHKVRIGPLPGVGLPFKLSLKGDCLLGQQTGTHAEIYQAIQDTLRDQRLLGASQQAMNLAYVLEDRGWLGALAPWKSSTPEGRQHDEERTVLGSTMWSMCQGNEGVDFEAWCDKHTVAWRLQGKGVACAVDGWELPFTSTALRALFTRMYE